MTELEAMEFHLASKFYVEYQNSYSDKSSAARYAVELAQIFVATWNNTSAELPTLNADIKAELSEAAELIKLRKIYEAISRSPSTPVPGDVAIAWRDAHDFYNERSLKDF